MNKRSTYALVLTFLTSFGLANNCLADEQTTPRHIVSLGCHDVNGTCFVTLDGTPFGSTLGCSVGAITQFRFDNGDTDEGKRAYASFLAAFLAGKQVSVDLSGCTTQGYPQLVYFNIYFSP